jgi:hypothetical protein
LPWRRANRCPLAAGRIQVDLVLRQLGIELADDDAVLEQRAVDRDVAVDHVLAHGLGVALERVAEAAAAG